jgi:hypothetical protein
MPCESAGYIKRFFELKKTLNECRQEVRTGNTTAGAFHKLNRVKEELGYDEISVDIREENDDYSLKLDEIQGIYSV